MPSFVRSGLLFGCCLSVEVLPSITGQTQSFSRTPVCRFQLSKRRIPMKLGAERFLVSWLCRCVQGLPCVLLFFLSLSLPQWGATDAEIKVPSGENTELKRSPSLKLGVGQYIAIRATLTARDFCLAYFYPSGPFTCIFSKTSPDFSCVGCG